MLKNSKVIELTVGCNHVYPINKKYPSNMIVMDFLNKEDIIKYGVKRVF